MKVAENLSAGIFRAIAELKRAVNSNRIVSGVGYTVRESTNGSVLEISSGGGGGAVSSPMIIQTALANYFVCRTWDGTTEGSTDILVAKSYNCRQPASRIYLGVTYDYTYTAGADSVNDTRVSDNGTDTETQMVTPPYDDDMIIWAKRVSWSGVEVDDVDLKLMEDTERCWAKVTPP